MVNTRSNSTKAKEEKMTTATEELKCYFKKLIEPLVTNNSLEELFNKLKDEIVKKFDEKISEKNAKIAKLLTKAKGLIKGNSNVKYVYSDINCSLALRLKDDSFKYFNSERELLSLLNV